MSGKLPKPYVNEVRKDDSTMVYVPMEQMDIGARSSGLPRSASSGPKSLEHVGSGSTKSASAKK